MSTPRSTGATPMGDDRRKRGGWWKWLLALLLLLLLLVVVAVVLLTGGGDDDIAAGTKPAAGATATAQATPVDPEAASTGATAPAGTLSAAGGSLLGSASIADADGDRATGEGLQVLAVEDAGFFVGTSAADRVFVEYGGDVGVDEQQAYVPKVGDVVDLDGPVAEAPEDPAATLKVDADTGKAISDLGGYVNADTVKKVG